MTENIVTLDELCKKYYDLRGTWFSFLVNPEAKYKIRNYSDESPFYSSEKNQLGQKVKFFVVSRLENGVLKCAGLPTDFKISYTEKYSSYGTGAMELDNLCFTLYSHLDYGIMANCMTEEFFKYCLGGLEIHYEYNHIPFWLASPTKQQYGDVYFVGMKYFNGMGKVDDFWTQELSHDLKTVNIHKIELAVCPTYLISYKNKNIKVRLEEGHDGRSPETACEILLG